MKTKILHAHVKERKLTLVCTVRVTFLQTFQSFGSEVLETSLVLRLAFCEGSDDIFSLFYLPQPCIESSTHSWQLCIMREVHIVLNCF